ncbi:MAG TPA: DUF935 family protein, partial [Polyangiaceae bacterium]|nr:DUF935 family protein [Polyangiaceae bacterium]
MSLRTRARSVVEAAGRLLAAVDLALSLSDPAPALTAEVGADDNDANLEVLQTRDEVLKAHGNGDVALYEKLHSDEQVYSTLRQRRNEVISRETKVDPGADDELSKLAAEDLKKQMKRISWDKVRFRMLGGLVPGYRPGECMFDIEEGTNRVLLKAIKVRRSSRFRFAPDGTLCVMRKGRPERLPDKKFWVCTFGAEDDDDPNGLGLGHMLYWPVWFKRNGLKFWSQFLEFFANPTPVAVVPAGTDEAQRNKLLALLGRITNGGRIVVPRGIDVQLLQAMRSSGGDFQVFVDKLDAMIAKIVLTQTMTTDDGSSYAQAQVHYKVSQRAAKTDADLLDESFTNTVARWLTEWNYPGAAVPVVYTEFSDADDLGARIERDVKLNGLGYRPRAKYVAEVYGDNYDFVPPPAPTDPGTGPTFAETGSAIDDLL